MPIKAIKGIITYKGKYLLQLRDNKKRISFPNHWGLFGGRKDAKETDIQTIIREIKEETNLDIKIEKKILSVNFEVIGLKKKRVLIYFDCKIKNSNSIILKEGKKYDFFSFNKLRKLNVVPMDFVAIKSHHLKNNGFISIYK
jgi:8-oxo-dGTP diphosphatase